MLLFVSAGASIFIIFLKVIEIADGVSCNKIVDFTDVWILLYFVSAGVAQLVER